jgi:hypothetical protein
MQVKLCKKSLERLGPDGTKLIEQLTERQHGVVIKDCLERCQGCQLGLLIASADGAPMSARSIDKFVADLDELMADELA